MNTQHEISARVQRLKFASFGQEEKPAELPVELFIAKEAPPLPLEIMEPPKLVPEEAVQAARNEGHAEGYKEGYAAALAKVNQEAVKREEAVTSILETIASRITLAAEDHSAYMARQQAIMSRLALAIARKIAGDAVKTDPYESVEAVLRECLALLIGEAKIIVTVPVALSAGLKQRIEALRPLLPGFNGELAVEEDPGMGENDCRVEWKNGHAERDMAKLWNDIETIIASLPKNNFL